ncbi:MAG: HlyD family efflux transporter periplasmic adaptor subunit [Chitinivibrionales bacterium]|nr:HlyD family efflux transporter periplasmic adaptor subunit [Chitinivibrionales bacterium]
MKFLRKAILPIVILAIGILIMNVMASREKEQRRKPSRPFERAVAAKIVEYTDARPQIVALGRVRARDRVRLTPEVPGIVLSKGFVLRKGRSLAKGELLFRIDDNVALNNYRTTLSELLNAVAKFLPDLKTDLPDSYSKWETFFRELTDSNLPQLPKTSSPREKLFIARFNFYRLYYMAQNQRLTWEKHFIRAPFAGVVADAAISPGSMVHAGSAVGTIVRSDIKEIEIALSQTEVRFARVDSKAEIRIGNLTYQGKIDRIGDIIDDRMQTIPVFILLNGRQAPQIKDGLLAEVHLQGPALSNATVLPRAALYNKSEMFKVAGGMLQPVAVETAYLSLQDAYVTSGLHRGDTVVVESMQDAIPGMRVKASVVN